MIDEDKHGILSHFNGRLYITKDDLLRYYRKREPDLKEATFRWRVYQLKEKQVLMPVKRGVYQLRTADTKQPFNPTFSRRLLKLYGIYFSSFKMEVCSLWSTEWLSQFMSLQPTNSFVVFEIEKELTHPLFFYLQQEKIDAFLEPTHEMMRDYVLQKKNPVIVRPLVTRAPLQTTTNGFPIASLEKILVDLFCDQDVFIPFQGSELKNIYSNAWKIYSINLSVLLNYARRRRREKDLIAFIKKNVTDMYTPLTYDRA